MEAILTLFVAGHKAICLGTLPLDWFQEYQLTVHYKVLVSAQGQYSNGRGQDNAQAKGECIILPKTATILPERTN